MPDLLGAALVPHPPIAVPAVGGEESERVRTTRTAFQQLAGEVVDLKPEVVVIISPHGPVFSDAIAVHRVDSIGGSLGAFGAPQITCHARVAADLGEALLTEGRKAGLALAPVTAEWASEWQAEELDHGTLVPLYFLQEAGYRGAILPVAMGLLPPVELYAFGQALQRAIRQTGRPTVVLASGDLSHRLSPEAPGGYSSVGAHFDRTVIEALGRADLAALFAIDYDLRERAGECGYRPLLMLAGALDGLAVTGGVLSYEHPFGVGYAVATFRPRERSSDRELLPLLKRQRVERIERRRQAAHPLVRLAQEAVELYVKTGMTLDFSAGAPHEGTASVQLPVDLPESAGAFVTITVDGDLRGCMGSVAASEPTLAMEVVRNAISAGHDDPRFSPVEEEELPFLEYKVDVLEPAEPCTLSDLDPTVFGVVVKKGEAMGLLLPDLPGVDRPEEQVAIARRKAGLEPNEPGIELQRFRVRRFY